MLVVLHGADVGAHAVRPEGVLLGLAVAARAPVHPMILYDRRVVRSLPLRHPSNALGRPSDCPNCPDSR